jgi:hypothetical protein
MLKIKPNAVLFYDFFVMFVFIHISNPPVKRSIGGYSHLSPSDFFLIPNSYQNPYFQKPPLVAKISLDILPLFPYLQHLNKEIRVCVTYFQLLSPPPAFAGAKIKITIKKWLKKEHFLSCVFF